MERRIDSLIVWGAVAAAPISSLTGAWLEVDHILKSAMPFCRVFRRGADRVDQDVGIKEAHHAGAARLA